MAEKLEYNRRSFLKIIGATGGMAAAGCAKEVPEKLIPYVIQPDEVVPGVATWYASSCGECSAGCGMLVRTREGRVVKVEGNPRHPINKGGLCAVAQSSVQGLYDPDRVREPLKRDINGVFAPVTWQVALDTIAEAIAVSSKTNKATVVITKPLSGSAATLTDEFLSKVKGAEHIEYTLFSKAAHEEASKKTFGEGVTVHYDFSQPRVILSLGADYLETWISPVEFTKGFSSGRLPAKDGSVSKVFHIEPRLSLTAANADQWLMNAPGSEEAILYVLAKLLVDSGAAKGAAGSTLSSLVKDIEVDKLVATTSLSKAQIQGVADALAKAPSSLVVAGGVSTSGSQAVHCVQLALLINAALGNVGKSVVLRPASATAKSQAAAHPLQKLIERLKGEKTDVGVVILSGINPAFTMPRKSEFIDGLVKAPLVVALASQLDETANLAQIVLPLSSPFEAWGDAEPAPGVFNLLQPSMQPLYKSQSYGDTLISLAASQKLNLPFPGIGGFYDYVRANWKKRTGEANFESRWSGYVQSGGDWSAPAQPLTSWQLAATAGSIPKLQVWENEGLSLLAFPTVLFGDGSPSNRPWLQEIPDPLTGVVWGSWVEVHPETAESLGVRGGRVVQVITADGSFEAPLYANKNIHPQLVAIPIGQGHDTLGRYSNGVGINPLNALYAENSDTMQQFLRKEVTLRPSVSREEMVVSQGSDTEYDRGFVRRISTAQLSKATAKAEAAHKAHDAEHGQGEEHEEGHGGHEDLHALGPRPEPKQMYKQMDHVLYKWGMTVDVSSCTGCTACVAACYAENNIAVVGKELFAEGREMSWLKIERYFDGPETEPVTGFLPMMCQHCANAPCEPVCPVYATYHSEEGLNTMVYNRCVGTRYCSNNCSYKVRRFNWFEYAWPEPLNWQLNPDLTTRGVGVMEKCSFCIQRIREVENIAKNEGRPVQDGEIKPACASSCPADCIRFGDLNDEESLVSKDRLSLRSYRILDAEINTQPAVTYLAKVTPNEKQVSSEAAEH